jgi:hypothetical protein
MSAVAGAQTLAAAARPRVRHGLLAAALLLVGGLRLAGGDLLWAGVLAGGGLVEAGLAVAARRSERLTGATADPPAVCVEPGVAAPRAAVLERSLAAHRRSRTMWWLSLATCTALGAALLSSAPALSAVLAVLALVSLQRVRRTRRSIGSLQRISDSDRLRDGRGA